MEKKLQCYLCKKKTVKKAFTKLGWTILHCSSCGLFKLDFQGSYKHFIKEYYNKKFGNKVRLSSIEDVNFKKSSFDLVTLFDVVEHVENPRKVLLKIHNLLKEKGLLVINTGDTNSFFAKLQGKYWHFFIPPQHFFYFSQ